MISIDTNILLAAVEIENDQHANAQAFLETLQGGRMSRSANLCFLSYTPCFGIPQCFPNRLVRMRLWMSVRRFGSTPAGRLSGSHQKADGFTISSGLFFERAILHEGAHSIGALH